MFGSREFRTIFRVATKNNCGPWLELGIRHSVKSKNVSGFLTYTFFSGNHRKQDYYSLLYLVQWRMMGRLDERMANLFIVWWILPKNWVNFYSSLDRSWKIILRKFEGTLLFKKIRQEGKTLRTSRHVCYILISQRKLFIRGRIFVWCVKHIFIQPLSRNIQFI